MNDLMKNGKICGMCKKAQVFTACSCCGIPVCENCTFYEMNISGCCFAWPSYYCLKCAKRTSPCTPPEEDNEEDALSTGNKRL